MKRWKKILCAALALLVLLVAGVALWQKENLKAVKDAMQYSSEELEAMMEENQQTIRDAVDAMPEITVREVTDEERQALWNGSITQEELIERLLDTSGQTAPLPNKSDSPAENAQRPAENGQTPAESSQKPAENGQKPAEEAPKPADDSYQKELSAIIAKVYVLREEYTGALDSMYESAKAEYLALSAEQRTQASKSSIASKYLSMASSLEGRCDAQMDSIVSSMESLIRANNGDMSLVDAVMYTYANEKSLKKSWYMSQLN